MKVIQNGKEGEMWKKEKGEREKQRREKHKTTPGAKGRYKAGTG